MAQAAEVAMQLRSDVRTKDAEIAELKEHLEQLEGLQERIRGLEKENSEMKAAKLMSMFNGA